MLVQLIFELITYLNGDPLCFFLDPWQALLVLSVYHQDALLGWSADPSCSLFHTIPALCIPFVVQQLAYLWRVWFHHFFLLFLQALLKHLMFCRSAKDNWGHQKLYVRSWYLRESPLHPLQPAFPPLCSPLSNCCSGPSPWKNRITSFTLTPSLVSTW